MASTQHGCEEKGTRRTMVIGIPTVPRERLVANENEYLLQTLQSLQMSMEELVVTTELNIQVIVVNHRGPSHDAFVKAKSIYAQDSRFTFLDNTKVMFAADTSDIKVDERVYVQSIDLVTTLDLAVVGFHDSDLFLIHEDDFEHCPDFFMTLNKIVMESDVKFQNWVSMRISYGFNGVLMHIADVKQLARYLDSRKSFRNPDHILVEFFAGETHLSNQWKAGRPHLTHRWNLMRHIGLASTLRPRRGTTPQHDCGVVLDNSVLFEVEMFKECCEGCDVCVAGVVM